MSSAPSKVLGRVPGRSLARTLGMLLLIGGPAPLAAAAESGVDGPRQPYELTRSLQALQDQIAFGSHAATAAQRVLLIHIGEKFASAPRSVWRDPANARAAIVYVLSGGRPSFLNALIRDGTLPEAEAGLARGALAYATGNRQEAWSILGPVDARALPLSLGAHVALVQASLTMASDPRSAAGHLDTARLLAPGTLIEDAALRRQLSVASEMSDAEGFTFLARQYIRRFRHSVYATNFVRAFPQLWGALGLPDSPETFAGLEATVAGLDSEMRLGLYLALAHQRLAAGDTGIARFAALRAAGLAAAGSAESARAALYGAAADVVAGNLAQAIELLRTIEPASLSEDDAELRAAALAVADQVLSEPQSIALPEGEGGLETSALLERGTEALAAADALLRKTR